MSLPLYFPSLPFLLFFRPSSLLLQHRAANAGAAIDDSSSEKIIYHKKFSWYCALSGRDVAQNPEVKVPSLSEKRQRVESLTKGNQACAGLVALVIPKGSWS